MIKKSFDIEISLYQSHPIIGITTEGRQALIEFKERMNKLNSKISITEISPLNQGKNHENNPQL